MLRGLWRAYETQLAANPVRTQMATSCFLWGGGDVLAQCIEHYEEQQYGSSSSKPAPASQTADSCSSSGRDGEQHAQSQQRTPQLQQQQDPQAITRDSGSKGFTVDKRRTLLTAVGFGAAFVGPVGEFWYSGGAAFSNLLHINTYLSSSSTLAAASSKYAKRQRYCCTYANVFMQREHGGASMQSLGCLSLALLVTPHPTPRFLLLAKKPA
jgi:hypothetical protein